VRENFVRAGGGLAVKTAVTEHVLDIAPLDAFPNQDFPKGEKAVPATAMGALVAWVGSQSWRIHAMGATPVIFTSRQERTFSDDLARLAFGEAVSAFLMDVERGLPPTLGYLICKGGITSNDTLSQGLALASARVLGQILPGVSVVRCPDDHPSFPGMPVVIFPGNVGGDDALRTAFLRLSRREEVAGVKAA
jgi:uncharacterized protein YgbK (DUF1537 family)